MRRLQRHHRPRPQHCSRRLQRHQRGVRRHGVATIKVLREINPELKVVLISGALLSEIENLEEAGELAGLLQKPFNYSAMKELLIRLTGGAPEAD